MIIIYIYISFDISTVLILNIFFVYFVYSSSLSLSISLSLSLSLSHTHTHTYTHTHTHTHTHTRTHINYLYLDIRDIKFLPFSIMLFAFFCFCFFSLPPLLGLDLASSVVLITRELMTCSQIGRSLQAIAVIHLAPVTIVRCGQSRAFGKRFAGQVGSLALRGIDFKWSN